VSDEDVRVVVAEILNLRVWLFVHNKTGNPFYTSDHPLAEHGEFGTAVESIATSMARTLAEKNCAAVRARSSALIASHESSIGKSGRVWRI
jgi:hypothetical protein